MNRSGRALAGTGVPLVLGALFYVLLRPHEAWLIAPLTQWSPVASMRSTTVAFGASLPPIVLAVAPDLAWAGAFGALLAATCSKAPTRWFWFGLTFVGGYELLQLAQIIPGTWDPADLVAQLVGFMAGFALGGSTIDTGVLRLRAVGKRQIGSVSPGHSRASARALVPSP